LATFQPNIIHQILKLANDVESNPGPENHHLNVIFSNINSLTADDGKRFEDLKLRLYSEKVHMAAISETGPNLRLENFNIYHFHRLDGNFYRPQGRGTIIYVHESLIVKRRHDLEDDNSECMWLETKFNHKRIIFGSYYRSPSQTSAARDQFFQAFDRSVWDNYYWG
jgi:hypothetical protein